MIWVKKTKAGEFKIGCMKGIENVHVKLSLGILFLFGCSSENFFKETIINVESILFILYFQARFLKISKKLNVP